MVPGTPRTEPMRALRARQTTMVDQLSQLVTIESPSADVEACRRCAGAVGDLGAEVLGIRPLLVEPEGRPHLLWRFGTPTHLLLVGHFDTVWPIGTIDRWPFTVEDGEASGPGAFDMKAGIVQALHALACLDDLDGISLLLTSDEELGSPTSRALIEETAAGVAAALVLEPSEGGALKTARKGISQYRLDVTGRAAHAGLAPERGINATIEVAHQVLAVAALARPETGTTVTPTTTASGTTSNTVPAAASLHIDVRVPDSSEQERVDRAIRSLRPVLAGACLDVTGGPNRPPMPPEASAGLMTRARKLAVEMGLGELAGVAVGGGSDGNITAGIGVPTLDGLGAVGDLAHAEGEYVRIDCMPERAALLSCLVEDLLTD